MGCYDGLAAVIPVLGAFIIWLPAAVFLALEDHWTQAISLVLWDMLVAATINNLLRLVLVGNRLHQHTLLIFMSLVGDLILFGSSELMPWLNGVGHYINFEISPDLKKNQ